MAELPMREAKMALFAFLSFLSLLVLCLRGLPQLLSALKLALTKPSEPRDALWHAVCEKMLARKVRQYCGLLHFFCLLTLSDALMNLVKLALDHERHNSTKKDVVAIALTLLVLPPCVKPGLITAKTLDAHYVLMMLLFTLNVAPLAGKPGLNHLLISNSSVAALNIARRSVATQRLPLLLGCSSFFCTVAVLGLVEGGPKAISFQEQLVMQVAFVSFSLLGALALETGFVAMLRQNLQLEAVKELHAAACALLRSFCECTVELDGDGVIMENQLGLCSFLMRGSVCSLGGKRLSELLAEEDRELFEGRLREPRMRKVGLAEALPVSMRDACGNNVRVELMWFDYRTVDGCRNFMLGIKEMADCRPGELSDSRDLPPLPKEEGATTEVSSSNPDAAILVVNAVEAAMPVKGQTRAMEAQVGKVPQNAPLGGFVKKPEQFLAWVQRAALEEAPTKAEVTLLMPFGSFRAQCKVIVTGDLEALGLLFTRITPAQRRRQGSSGKGSPSSVSSEGSTRAVSL